MIMFKCKFSKIISVETLDIAPCESHVPNEEYAVDAEQLMRMPLLCSYLL